MKLLHLIIVMAVMVGVLYYFYRQAAAKNQVTAGQLTADIPTNVIPNKDIGV